MVDDLCTDEFNVPSSLPAPETPSYTPAKVKGILPRRGES